jgi:hypothetical protein
MEKLNSGRVGTWGMLVHRNGAASAYATGGKMRSVGGEVEDPRWSRVNSRGAEESIGRTRVSFDSGRLIAQH